MYLDRINLKYISKIFIIITIIIIIVTIIITIIIITTTIKDTMQCGRPEIMGGYDTSVSVTQGIMHCFPHYHRHHHIYNNLNHIIIISPCYCLIVYESPSYNASVSVTQRIMHCFRHYHHRHHLSKRSSSYHHHQSML